MQPAGLLRVSKHAWLHPELALDLAEYFCPSMLMQEQAHLPSAEVEQTRIIRINRFLMFPISCIYWSVIYINICNLMFPISCIY